MSEAIIEAQSLERGADASALLRLRLDKRAGRRLWEFWKAHAAEFRRLRGLFGALTEGAQTSSESDAYGSAHYAAEGPIGSPMTTPRCSRRSV